MKPSLQSNLLLTAGIVCIFGSIFGEQIGLPEWTAFVVPVLGVGFFWLAMSVQRRAKIRGDAPATPPPTRSQYDKCIRLLIICAIAGSLTAPLYLRYTLPTLPFYQLIICSVLGCATCVTILLLTARRNRPKE